MQNPQQRIDGPFKTFIKRHYLPIVISIVVTLLGIIGSDTTLWMRFDRNAIISGEIWRVFTGHLVHLTWSHLFMNIFGLALIWALFDIRLSKKRWFIAILAGAFGTSLGLLLLNPQLRWYVGLSGVLHTLFIVGCLYDLRAGRWDAKILLTIIISKLLWEQVMGPLPGSEFTAGGTVIVDAHLYGALTGFVIFSIFRRADERASRTLNGPSSRVTAQNHRT